MIGRTDIGGLVQRVGAKIDLLEITDNTVPTHDHVVQWIEDGTIRLLGVLPERMLLSFVDTVDLPFDSGSKTASGVFNALKPLRASLHGGSWAPGQVPCFITEPSEGSASDYLATRTNHQVSEQWVFPWFQPVVSFRYVPGEGGDSEGAMTLVSADEIYYDPPGAELDDPFWRIEYIAPPRPAANWPGPLRCPPLEWEEALVDYAAIQAKVQDEEMNQAQLLIQVWERKVAEMAQGGVYGSFNNIGGS